ncbi:hypothetical protein Pen02_35590 [Plantactinospora endophytica]|uniref:Major facilitator superfamily (MFS) profile domain-containing protein n=1 Tax=Plantactinospora endophytica TaxID=673535 RepID=A0ABQ4E1P8_9ACTN|nr:hypothetical protein Pen02_35590 [Plantactinospora endophytica]
MHITIFAHREVGLGVDTAGLTAAVIGMVGLAGRVFWGRLFERVAAAHWLLLGLALAGIAGIGLLLAAGATGIGALVWAAAVVHGGGALAANLVVMLAAIRRAGRNVGRISGVMGGGQFLGFAAGPVAFGALVDATDSYPVGWLAVATAYGLAAVVMVGWAGWLRRRPVPVDNEPLLLDDRPAGRSSRSGSAATPCLPLPPPSRTRRSSGP